MFYSLDSKNTKVVPESWAVTVYYKSPNIWKDITKYYKKKKIKIKK
jgi:hypothetical protein